MIIFDLDGTLADCEHRRHFVHAEKNPEYTHRCNPRGKENFQQLAGWYHLDTNKKFKPDWKSFYESCDKDVPIYPVIDTYIGLRSRFEIQIWSGRCESQYQKTYDWLIQNGVIGFSILKMRPIGDNTPDDQLKESWLDEYIFGEKCIFPTLKNAVPVNKIDFVFDDRPKVVRMWKRRGIFVFDVNQSGKEF